MPFGKVWEKAVEIFGRNQVRTFLVIGSGERRKSVVDGSAYLTELGVYPIIVSVRLIPGSILQDATPPCPPVMIEPYDEVSHILAQKAISHLKKVRQDASDVALVLIYQHFKNEKQKRWLLSKL